MLLVDRQHAEIGVHPQLGRNVIDANDLVILMRQLADRSRRARRELQFHKEAGTIRKSDVEAVVTAAVTPEVYDLLRDESACPKCVECCAHRFLVSVDADLDRETNAILLSGDELADIDALIFGEKVGACQRRTRLDPMFGVDDLEPAPLP
jgi:hypothetical protein